MFKTFMIIKINILGYKSLLLLLLGTGTNDRDVTAAGPDLWRLLTVPPVAVHGNEFTLLASLAALFKILSRDLQNTMRLY